MTGGARRPFAAAAHRRQNLSSSSSTPADSVPAVLRRRNNPALIRLMPVNVRALLFLSIAILVLIPIAFSVFRRIMELEGAAPVADERLTRLVTPLPGPKMMDLDQFQGEHKESLYWGTYRPHLYLGIRARTPSSLMAGLMWIRVKDGQYHLRHDCKDSDDLSTYGWTDHNGRDYGRQVLVDHGLELTTSFLKERTNVSGYGGDWAVRLEAHNANSRVDVATHLFFYMADEGGNSLRTGREDLQFHKGTPLAFGSHHDFGDWEVHLKSLDNVEIHYAGFRTLHMHNISELVQRSLAVNARRKGLLQLPDIVEDSSNIMVFQISAKLPSKMDIAFVSGTDSMSTGVNARINRLTGMMLTSRLNEKQKDFERNLNRVFNLNEKVDSEAMVVGRAAIGNLLGGIGYFYGQSKIALPPGLSQNNGDKFILYWPAALFTAVPSRSFFPRGFLWDEGFHQLMIWRWDINICMDIIGHWLDLINKDGWIPREQILGAEALSKVPQEAVLQYPSNGNPPTLFIVLHDLMHYAKTGNLSVKEVDDISTFVSRAYGRLGAWFQWFNVTQRGKDMDAFYWHGRDNTTVVELNPQTLTSGLDDYPRASHPSSDERHLDLRCWMLLAAECMHSIAELLGIRDGLEKDYFKMAQELSNFENLNQMHLDSSSGVYFDFGNHTEKVRLRWHEIKHVDTVKRELVRETLEAPQLTFVPHVGYVNLFPLMMGIIPSESWILGRQLDLISNRSILWTDYGLRSLSKTSTMYMKHNTEHGTPYWRGPIWISMNYMILSGLQHYSREEGPYRARAGTLYDELRSNLIRNIVRNYFDNGFLWEHYDQKGKGNGAHPFTGWTSLVLLVMAEEYPRLLVNS